MIVESKNKWLPTSHIWWKKKNRKKIFQNAAWNWIFTGFNINIYKLIFTSTNAIVCINLQNLLMRRIKIAVQMQCAATRNQKKGDEYDILSTLYITRLHQDVWDSISINNKRTRYKRFTIFNDFNSFKM